MICDIINVIIEEIWFIFLMFAFGLMLISPIVDFIEKRRSKHGRI